MRNLLELLDEPIGAASDPPTHLLSHPLKLRSLDNPSHWRLNDGNFRSPRCYTVVLYTVIFGRIQNT